MGKERIEADPAATVCRIVQGELSRLALWPASASGR